MKKNEDITIIIILVTSVIIIFSIGGLFWCVLKGDNQIDYAKHSDCLLYRNHSKEKINLSNLNNNQLVEGTLQSFNSKFKKKISLTDEDFAFIHRCENNMTYQASQMSINNFNKKKKFNYFQTFVNVVHGVTNNQVYSYQFAEMVTAVASDKQKLFINSLITFANLFANIYGFPIFQKLWYSIEFNNDIIKSNGNNPLAVTKLKKNGHYLAQCMIISGRTLQEHVNKKQYEIGFHSTADNISTIIHEIGHAIANYASVWPTDRIYFNHNINADTGKCTCESSSEQLNIRAFITNPGDLLVQYLGHQVGISNNTSFQQQLAAWSFIQSGYGQTSDNDELFAEGFAQWMLTPDEEKGLNWEILNEFYSTYFRNYYYLN